jgi:hypothetical protein
MDISNLITSENSLALHQALIIAKQDIALENAIKALNELSHIHRIEFENYSKTYGITEELISEVRNIKDKLDKAKFGRY